MPKAMSHDDVARWFKYHAPPDEATIEAHRRIRAMGKRFAKDILLQTPIGREQTIAIRKVREAVMWANAGIACGGK